MLAINKGRDAVARKSSVPDWVYYLGAVLCSLATIPMYRYMFAHASDGRQSAVSPVAYQRIVYAQSAPVASPGPSLKPLLPGELCEGGYVILRNGNVYTQGIGADGRPARCSGGFLIVPQR